MAFCIQGTAASAANSQVKPICKAIGMNNHKFTFFKKGTKMKYEVLLVPSIWHISQDTKLKSGNFLKQMLADFHFCTQSFSFLLMTMTFIDFYQYILTYVLLNQGISFSDSLGYNEKDKGRSLCLVFFFKSKKMNGRNFEISKPT